VAVNIFTASKKGDQMDKPNYIRTQDVETAEKLKQLGFVLLSEHNGISTFLNDIKKKQDFSGLIVTHTNKLEF
jgi:hypothetical protein